MVCLFNSSGAIVFTLVFCLVVVVGSFFFNFCRYQRSWTRAYTIGSTDSSIKLAGISTVDNVVKTYQTNGIPTQFNLNTTVQVNSYERYVALETVKTAFRIILEVVLISLFRFLVFFFLGVLLNPINPINRDDQYDRYDRWNLSFNATGM